VRKLPNICIAYKCSIFSSYISRKSFCLIPKELRTFNAVEEEPVPSDTTNSETLIFQMQVYIMVALFLSSGAVSAGLEQVLNIAEFIAGIYQQFPSSCIVIINSEAQQQGEN
jgi:hypothetical protein